MTRDARGFADSLTISATPFANLRMGDDNLRSNSAEEFNFRLRGIGNELP